MRGASRAAVAAALAATTLGGCASEGPGARETVGALAGAVGGAMVAAGNIGAGTGRDIAAVGGALLGAAAGADIGRSLDRANAGWRPSAARASRPTGHSQQVPVPGFAPAPHRGPGLAALLADLFTEDPPIPTLRDASECSPLDDDTLRPAFDCRTAEGHRFVLQ